MTRDAVPVARKRITTHEAHSPVRLSHAQDSVVIPDTLQRQPEKGSIEEQLATPLHGTANKEAEAYIQLTQDGRKDERVRIDRPELIKAYVPVALEAGAEAFPRWGIGQRSPLGPYQIYADVEDIDAILASVATLYVKQGDKTIGLTMEKIIIDPEADASKGTAALSRSADSVHVICFLQEGAMFRAVTKKLLKDAWDAAGFVVGSASRQHAKLEGMGAQITGLETEAIHLNVIPRNGAHIDAPWPSPLKVEAKANRWNDKPRTFYVRYVLDEHPKLRAELFCLRRCTMRRPCHCRPAGSPSAPGPSGPQAKKRKSGNAQRDEAMLALTSQFKFDRPCPHFKKGRCLSMRPSAPPCGFQHDDTDPTRIACNLKRLGKFCRNGEKCRYFHDWDLEELEDEDELYAPRPRKRRPAPRKRRRRSQKRFDSTLGYPGEGPASCIMTWNADGLCEREKLAAALRRARAAGADVLAVQEHNWKPTHREMVHSCARAGDWAVFWDEERVSANKRNGGAAVFVSLGNGSTVETTGGARCALDGRVVAVPVKILGTQTRIVSVYAPAQPRERKNFLVKMREQRVLKKGDLVMGDFNCVPDTNLDVKYPHGCGTYPNLHSKANEALMSDMGLTDVYRLFAGAKQDFSRRKGSVWTRLDRIYAPEYDSPWRWTACEYMDGYMKAKNLRSDHIALRVRVETAAGRKPSPHEERIDPALYRDENIRKNVRALWHRTYANEKGQREGHKWQAAKESCCQYLLEMTRARRGRASGADAQRRALEELNKAYANQGPVPTYKAARAHIEKRIVEEASKERRPSAWWSYVQSLREELSSKIFYRNFKKRNASPDISSLHVTPDWNQPDKKQGTVSEPGTICEELKNYYKWLFAPKPSDSAAAEPLLRKLRERQISKKSREALEAPVTEKEVRAAIRKMASGKAPGPDALGAEFYKEFEDLVATDMLRMFHETLRDGRYHKGLRSGHIIVLYKKGDPREIRNYRPITLLQVDYKIISKILVARLNAVMDEIVSSPQLGFVPGRVITEATHMLKLVQALAEEEDGEGIVIAADWEKAFDRVSWEYLHEAIDALGFGEQFMAWIGAMYNDHFAPIRRVKANGELSDAFSIKSGTPQGCPASPLIFLLVAEALTRAVLGDEDLKGYKTKSGLEVKLSQFADDTQFILRGYDQLKRMWLHIDRYEAATGMRANKQKFEGFRLGRTVREPVPDNQYTRPIAFVQAGKYMKLLGIPFGEDFDESDFLEQVYSRMKSIIATWRDHAKVSVFGRAMLANTMIFSRFRYYAQCMHMSAALTRAIEEDAQALVWEKEVRFDADAVGTQKNFRRFMKDKAQFGNRKTDVGVGLLPWGDHVRSLQINWLLRYIDATGGEWKRLLDHWLSRGHEERGTMFTNIPLEKLTQSTTQRRRALPKFWRDALEALYELGNIVKAHPNRWTRDDARAHPLWTSPLFTLTSKQERAWKRMELHTGKDLDKDDGSAYTADDILSYPAQLYTAATGGGYWVGNKIWDETAIVRDWARIMRQVPEALRKAARGKTHPQEWRYSAQAVSMMRNMGWSGGGLGPKGEGITEPIPAGRPRRANTEEKATPPRIRFVRARSKPEPLRATKAITKTRKQPGENPIKALLLEGVIYYGKACEWGLREWRQTTKGHLTATLNTLLAKPEDLRETITWRGKVVGMAEAFFPHPGEWRFEGLDVPLDGVTVRIMTRHLAAKMSVPPSCLRAWEGRIGELPSEIGERYNTRLLTPRDWASHYKNVLHRSLLVRSITTDAPCRCCGFARENLQHFAECEAASRLFKFLKTISASEVSETGREWERFCLFGLLPAGKLAEGWINLHLLMWKHLIALLVRIELEGDNFDEKAVWGPTWSRFERKVLALKAKVDADIRRADARGEPPRDMSKRTRSVAPLASFSKEGELVWNNELTKKIQAKFKKIA